MRNFAKFVVKNVRYASTARKDTYRCKRPNICVTLTSANNSTSQTVAFMLKQNPFIDEIRLFDLVGGTCGTALDLSCLDTSVVVKSYTGLENLAESLMGSTVIAICGGNSRRVGVSEEEMFEANADNVRTIALYAAEFSPKAVLCISTPPISSLVPLASEEYKKAKVYDPKKIIGVTKLGVIRGNSIIGHYVGKDPSKIMCPIIGAMSEKTIIPVVSQTKYGATLSPPVQEVLRSKIAKAEKEVLKKKFVENTGSCYITEGYAMASFIVNLAKAMLHMPTGYECGFVRQIGEASKFLPYMSSVIKLDRHGVGSIYMPHTTTFEAFGLQKVANRIREQIEIGECYVTGAIPKLKKRCSESRQSCSLVKEKHSTLKHVYAYPQPDFAKYGQLIPDDH